MKFKDRIFYSQLRAKMKQYKTLQEAADAVQIDRSLLSKYTKGTEPGIINFARLCEWMGVKMETFFK